MQFKYARSHIDDFVKNHHRAHGRARSKKAMDGLFQVAFVIRPLT